MFQDHGWYYDFAAISITCVMHFLVSDARFIISVLLLVVKDAPTCMPPVNPLAQAHRMMHRSLLIRFQQWQKRKPADAPTEADSCPTAALRCQHGQLLPEDAPGAKRQLVPLKLWQYFRDTAGLLEGADPAGYQAFEDDTLHCAICQVQFKLVASKQEGLRYEQFVKGRKSSS